MSQTDRKNEYARAVALFLAEQLRFNKITVEKAAKIAGDFLKNLNLMDTREDFSKWIRLEASESDELLELLRFLKHAGI